MAGGVPPPPAGFKVDKPPPEGFRIDNPGDPGVPNIPPSDLAGSIVKRIGKIVPRVGTQVGGAEVGGAIGGAIGNVPGAILGAGIGGGLGNVAGSKLPPEIGGDPSESTLHAFGWGAIPEAAGRGLAVGLESKAASKTAEAAQENLISELDKGPMAAEQAGGVASALGRRTLESTKPLTGEVLTDATNSLRQDILDPINVTRRKLGEPIGKAYDALKGNTTPLDEKQIADLREATQGVRDEMLAPYPKAKAIFNKIKSFSKPEPPEWMKPEYQGEHPPRPVSTDDFAAVDAYRKAVENYKPPTLDEIRELRQVNNQLLRGAKGGDVHAALGLQQALDEQLIDHLPQGINRDRELYRGFMNRFPWRDINKVNSMGTPRELGNYVFGGTPERTAEIVDDATPKGKVALREALTNRALDKVNPDAPLKDQVDAVRGALSEYIKNGTATKLYGTGNTDQLREIFYLPENMAAAKKVIQSPQFTDDMRNEVIRVWRSGNKAKMDAVEAGYQKALASLPEKTRESILNPTLPGAQLPVVMNSQEALESGLKSGAKSSTLAARTARRAEFQTPYIGARAAFNPAGAALQLGAMATMMGTSAGYRALMENGGAGVLARTFATPNGRAIARNVIEGLAAIGTQEINQPDQTP